MPTVSVQQELAESVWDCEVRMFAASGRARKNER
jgi:hypothetical protein